MRVVYLLALAVFLCGVKVYGQAEAAFTYRYFVGTKAPDVNWKDGGFDDSSWGDVTGNIGYGNNYLYSSNGIVTRKSIDSIIIPTTPSLFMRLTFTVDSISEKIPIEASMLADFDDGFVAYMNGVELLRVNMGEPGTPVAYDQLSDRSHDIIGRRTSYSPLLGYYMDTALLRKSMKAGKNVLSIEVHNDSLQGSDLAWHNFGFTPLNGVLVTPYEYRWHVIRNQKLDSTHLPIVVIETGETGVLTNARVMAKMKIINNKGKVNRLTDSAELSCDIGIKLRGNSSKDWPKKNYSVELRNPDSTNLNMPVVGMPAENDWVLNGNWADKSQIRNALSFHVGTQVIEGYTPRTRFCELVLNGQFMGLYLMMESIKRDSLRVDLKKLKDKDSTGNDITGGYIMKIDQQDFEMVYPQKEDISYDQLSYAKNIYSNYRVTAQSLELAKFKKMRGIVDVQAFIDYTIVNELTRNADAYQYSVFMYKDRNDIDSLLTFGPIWDFDLSFGNINVQGANKTSGWHFMHDKCYRLYHRYLFKDTGIVKQFRERWFELRKSVITKERMNHKIDSIVAYLGGALPRNYQVWPTDGRVVDIWGHRYAALTYKDDHEMMKTWVAARIDWMDQNVATMNFDCAGVQNGSAIWGDCGFCIGGTSRYKTCEDAMAAENEEPSLESQFQLYPNPSKNHIFCKFLLEGKRSFTATVYGVMGQKIYEQTFANDGENILKINTFNLNRGVYFVDISSDGSTIYTETFVKE